VNPFRLISMSIVPFVLAGLGRAATEFLPVVSLDRDPVLRFTGIPTTNSTELAEKYRPLAKHLSEKLGVQVEYVPSNDYGASVEAFKNGDVQLAWFGGLTGVQARVAVPDARVIACGKVDRKFHSYFIANAATKIEKSDAFPLALEGKKFTFGSEGSTSGRLMPEHFLRKETKKSPREFFGAEMSFSGGHDKTAALVAAGTFDAGAIDYTIYDRLVKEGKLDPAVCRVIWVTPDYVDYHFTAHPSLDKGFGAGFTEKLQKALVAVEDPKLLAAIERPDGLVSATNADFDGLRAVALELKLVR
jgi:phosphonate transport system substrate-binding protein